MSASKRIILCVAGLTLSACAGMSQQACLVSDWTTVGFEDGARGAPAETIGKYRKSCAEHGVAPDLQAYRAGRAEGLRQFCTPRNGFALGERGGRYHGVCPASSEEAFLGSYRTGRKLYDLDRAVRSASRKIQIKQNQINEIGQELTEKEAELVADATTSARRTQLLGETRELARKQGELEEEILGLERTHAVRQEERDRYRTQLSHSAPEY